MKKAVSIIMLVISTLLCSCLALAGVVTLVPKGFVDFPCFVYYDEANQCASMEGPALPDEDLQAARLQVFLTTYRVGWMGGGCNSRSAASDQVQMETSALDLAFVRQGDALLVNGKPLAAGDSFSYTQSWGFNPWVVEKIRFTNYGSIPICGKDVPSRVVVIGTYGSEASLLKGGLVLLIPLALVITFIILTIKAFRKKKT